MVRQFGKTERFEEFFRTHKNLNAIVILHMPDIDVCDSMFTVSSDHEFFANYGEHYYIDKDGITVDFGELFRDCGIDFAMIYGEDYPITKEWIDEWCHGQKTIESLRWFSDGDY